MKIQVKESTVVRPAEATPRGSLSLSNLDLLLPMNYHTRVLNYFRFNGTPNFFDSVALKAALSRALVYFYPAAGRLKMNGTRVEIDCNGEGVLFIEAEIDCRMDELNDFTPKRNLSFAPAVDYSQGISTFPLYLVQLTRFKCGGVVLGTANEHHLFDGFSSFYLFNTWADIARGLDVTVPPIHDRRAVLSARNPPQPMFTHDEYKPPPSLKIPQNNDSKPVVYKVFKLTREQINALKAKCHENGGATNYSTYEVVAGHAWRCITEARKLSEDQLTEVYISVDGRSRLRPPPPRGYFGNVLFAAKPSATAGELSSKSLKFSVHKIHDAIARIDHDYAISALDYLELQRDLSSIARGAHTYKCPNLGINGWTSLSMYGTNFGWGRAVYVGHGFIPHEGQTYLMPSPVYDGSILYAVSLPEDVMQRVEKVFYEDLRGQPRHLKGNL